MGIEDVVNASSPHRVGDALSHDSLGMTMPLAIYPPPNCDFNDCKANRLDQIQQAKQEWEFTADSMPQLIFLLDRDDRILRANRTLENWGLGHVATVRGRRIHDLLHPHCEDADCHLMNIWKSSADYHLMNIWRSSIDNMSQDFSIEYQTEDNILQRHLNLHFRFHRSPQNAEAGFIVAVISDISEAKNTEKMLQISNSELERRIEEGTFALISTNIRLKQEIEEHKRIEVKLEQSREEYSQLVEAMNQGLAILDKQGKITYVNKKFCDTLGYEREKILGHTPAEYIVEENRIALERHMAERLLGGVATYVANLKAAGGRKCLVKISPTLLEGKEGELTGSFAVINDNIDQTNVGQILSESAKEIEDLYDNAPCGYHTLDSNGVFIKINNTKIQWLGYTKDEMIGSMRFVDVLTPLSAQHYEKHFSRLKTMGYLRDLEVEMVRKDGSILPTLLCATAVLDAEGRFVMSRATLYDISYRKNAEQALRESEHAKRMLTAQVMSAQEKERKRITYELHDGIGQTLSAIKFYVENAIHNLNEHTIENSVQMFRNVIPKLQDAIEEVRRISMDLRPTLLDDIGTLATLSWFCRQFQTIYTSIRVELRLDIKEEDIPAPLKVAIFRIVQEAMNNCAKYSQADCIHIGLLNTEKELELAVEDNGQGFDHTDLDEKTNSTVSGMGLVSMRERAEFSGGIFSIESAKGRGTSVHVIWPYQEPSISS